VSPTADGRVQDAIAAIYRNDSRRVLATLVRLLGDFDLAEEAVQDAFVAASEQWPRDGLPINPFAWLVSTGRFKTIDRLRRRARFDSLLGELAAHFDEDAPDPGDMSSLELVDDRLALIFTCCHPALSPDAQVALTLREVCGLTTEEIAHAFLTSPSTVAQRIVRAKTKIRDAQIPYEVPTGHELAERLEVVDHVVYLVFNEAYSASIGPDVTRVDLSEEAIHLGRLLVDLLPDPETRGLLALMLLHDSRREARVSETGDFILLSDQDRSKWNRDRITEGLSHLREAMVSGVLGSYTLQAAIAAAHAAAPSAEGTDWNRIVELYDQLVDVDPSPVVALNRAAAVAMSDGPEAGLALIDGILATGDLGEYHLAHSAKADLLRRLGKTKEARASYQRALDLAQQEPERRFLARRLAETKPTAPR
jgi:RNA polymerase sigma-70 factor (ECF subfamily)